MSKRTIFYFLASFGFVTVIVIASYYLFDREIAGFFGAIAQDTLLKQSADILSLCGEGQWYIVVPLIIYAVLRKRSVFTAKAALLILSSTIISGIAVNILKVVFGRPRPQMFFSEKLYDFEWFHFQHLYASFPSGHSATAVGAWLAMALVLPKYRFFLISIGLLIALSRVVLTAHYLGDVIAGSYIGILTTVILYHFIMPSKQELSYAR